MNKTTFFTILKELEENEPVQKEVMKNFADNLWWPACIEDSRLRLLIGGLSSRISYSMIDTYRAVIFRIVESGYQAICAMSDDELTELIRPLGLFHTRVSYIRSMIQFISQKSSFFEEWSDEVFIKEIAQNVKNASYKIGQCCVLYYRMYPNRVMPVDSGMRDILLPCLGFESNKTAYGHEIMRKELTNAVTEIAGDYLKDTKLEYLNARNFYWWVHLSLIYYKRIYCNRKDSNGCIFQIEVPRCDVR